MYPWDNQYWAMNVQWVVQGNNEGLEFFLLKQANYQFENKKNTLTQ